MDSVHRSRSKLAIAVAVVTALYWLAMFVGTHVPIAPQPAQLRNSLDKLEHLAAFAGLSMLLLAAGALHGIAPRPLIFAVLGIVAAYGLVDEVTQSLVPHRETDFRDWLADMLGTGLGIAAFAIVRPLLFAGRSQLNR
jgi:VanZ family protein